MDWQCSSGWRHSVPAAVTAAVDGTCYAKDSMAQLANDTNFLVMGGFVVAGSMSIYGLDNELLSVLLRELGPVSQKCFSE